MTIYAKLLSALDEQFIFSKRLDSSVKKIGQGFDDQSNENVITLEYRVKVQEASTDPLIDEAKRTKLQDEYKKIGEILDAIIADMQRQGLLPPQPVRR